MGRLDNKVAIITGGAGGIGLQAGKLFAQEGAKVLLVDLHENALKEAVQTIGGDAVRYCAADVTQPDHTQRYIQAAVEQFGGVDILLANAGIEGEVKPITEYAIDTFDQVMAVNVRGVWLGLKYAAPEIAKRGGGSIVITSSVAGVRGAAGMSAYIASKHAVIGLMRTAALEMADRKIRVNTVNPAPVDTRMMRSLEKGFEPDDPGRAKEMVSAMVPLQRYADPVEVARIMLFLASDESSYCSGGVYMIDGGMTART
jgi:NAD(P)-dependent dehydrogenase (short-subunit alcohol dehydrogenase family)